LPFQWHFTKQNGVIRLKSNILAPPKFFGQPQIFGMATPLLQKCVIWCETTTLLMPVLVRYQVISPMASQSVASKANIANNVVASVAWKGSRYGNLHRMKF